MKDFLMGDLLLLRLQIYSWLSIRLHVSLKLGSQMSRLRQLMKQVLIYLNTLNLGIVTFCRIFVKNVLHIPNFI